MKLPSKPNPKIPLLILTGFLGSGKTTLLNNILTQAPSSAVIINEFGATPVDQQLLGEHKVLLSTLSGGCLCCQVKGALMPVLKNLRMTWENMKEKPFDRIIIETSGIANPEPVLDMILKQSWLSARYSLQGIIATISALSGIDTLNRFPEAQAQIAWADTIAITHTDLSAEDVIQTLENRLSQLSPAAQQIRVINGKTTFDNLLAYPVKIRPILRESGMEPISHHFHSVTVQIEQPVSWQVLEAVLLNVITLYGDRLLRLKGLVFDPALDHPLLVQGVNGMLHPPVQLPARTSDDFTGRLVFITDGAIAGLTDAVKALLISPPSAEIPTQENRR